MILDCCIDVSYRDNPAGKHLVPKTSSRIRFQDVQNVKSEDVLKN